MTPQQLRTTLNQINDLMIIGGATLTERQEDVLYMALKVLLAHDAEKLHPGQCAAVHSFN